MLPKTSEKMVFRGNVISPIITNSKYNPPKKKVTPLLDSSGEKGCVSHLLCQHEKTFKSHRCLIQIQLQLAQGQNCYSQVLKENPAYKSPIADFSKKKQLLFSVGIQTNNLSCCIFQRYFLRRCPERTGIICGPKSPRNGRKFTPTPTNISRFFWH